MVLELPVPVPALDPVAPEVMYLVILLKVFFSIVLSLSVIFSIVCLMLVFFVGVLDFLLTLLLLRGGGCGGSVLTFTLVSKGAFPSFLRVILGTFFIVWSSIHCWLGWGLNIAWDRISWVGFSYSERGGGCCIVLSRGGTIVFCLCWWLNNRRGCRL